MYVAGIASGVMSRGGSSLTVYTGSTHSFSATPGVEDSKGCYECQDYRHEHHPLGAGALGANVEADHAAYVDRNAFTELNDAGVVHLELDVCLAGLLDDLQAVKDHPASYPLGGIPAPMKLRFAEVVDTQLGGVRAFGNRDLDWHGLVEHG